MKTKTFLYQKRGAIEEIVKAYTEVTMTVTDMAKKYDVSTRTIQRLLKQYGLIRTIAEANQATAKLKNYEALKVPEHLKVKRKYLTRKMRLEVFQKYDRCNICGATKNEAALQIDHIDGNPSNNDMANLQVLCIYCNQGKR